MKTRQGFVSNSSSSSFIVGFTHRPTSVEELQDMMFSGKSYMVDPFEDKKTWPTEDIARRVFRDLGQELSFPQLVLEYGSGYFPGYPEQNYDDCISDLTDDEYLLQNARSDAAINQIATEHIQQLLKENPNRQWFCFSYADENGEAFLEHSGIFNNLPHRQISHH